jgi:hypothetical protein
MVLTAEHSSIMLKALESHSAAVWLALSHEMMLKRLTAADCKALHGVLYRIAASSTALDKPIDSGELNELLVTLQQRLEGSPEEMAAAALRPMTSGMVGPCSLHGQCPRLSKVVQGCARSSTVAFPCMQANAAALNAVSAARASSAVASSRNQVASSQFSCALEVLYLQRQLGSTAQLSTAYGPHCSPFSCFLYTPTVEMLETMAGWLSSSTETLPAQLQPAGPSRTDWLNQPDGLPTALQHSSNRAETL